MYDFMAWLQGSLLGHAMRESGVWTYGVVNLFHILGVASLFGSIVILDFRLLGFWRKERPTWTRSDFLGEARAFMILSKRTLKIPVGMAVSWPSLS